MKALVNVTWSVSCPLNTDQSVQGLLLVVNIVHNKNNNWQRMELTLHDVPSLGCDNCDPNNSQDEPLQQLEEKQQQIQHLNVTLGKWRRKDNPINAWTGSDLAAGTKGYSLYICKQGPLKLAGRSRRTRWHFQRCDNLTANKWTSLYFKAE